MGIRLARHSTGRAPCPCAVHVCAPPVPVPGVHAPSARRSPLIRRPVRVNQARLLSLRRWRAVPRERVATFSRLPPSLLACLSGGWILTCCARWGSVARPPARPLGPAKHGPSAHHSEGVVMFHLCAASGRGRICAVLRQLHAGSRSDRTPCCSAPRLCARLCMRLRVSAQQCALGRPWPVMTSSVGGSACILANAQGDLLLSVDGVETRGRSPAQVPSSRVSAQTMQP